MPLWFRPLEKPPVHGFRPGSSSPHFLILRCLGSSFDEAVFVEFLGDRRRSPNEVARPVNGFAYLLRMPAGDGGNFAERKALDTVQEKSLAVGLLGDAELSVPK